LVGALVAAGAVLLVARPSPVERGRYVVSIMACDDCHTPLKMGANGPEPDVTRSLPGHPERLILASAPALGSGWTWAGAVCVDASGSSWSSASA
jgi:hypothetical protein